MCEAMLRPARQNRMPLAASFFAAGIIAYYPPACINQACHRRQNFQRVAMGLHDFGTGKGVKAWTLCLLPNQAVAPRR